MLCQSLLTLNVFSSICLLPTPFFVVQFYTTVSTNASILGVQLAVSPYLNSLPHCRFASNSMVSERSKLTSASINTIFLCGYFTWPISLLQLKLLCMFAYIRPISSPPCFFSWSVQRTPPHSMHTILSSLSYTVFLRLKYSFSLSMSQ